MKILVVEDEPKLAEYLRKALTENNYVVDVAHDGIDGHYLAGTGNHDLVLLDIMLPGRDGLSLLRELRRSRTVPVLMLTARDSVEDRVTGLQAGADDYLVKPFVPEEVVLRLRALLRRGKPRSGDTVLTAGPLEYDTVSQRFSLRGQPVDLTAQEQRILAYLMHRRGATVTRAEIGEHVYSRDLEPGSNSVDVLIGRIRRKIGADLIGTRRGLGFWLTI